MPLPLVSGMRSIHEEVEEIFGGDSVGLPQNPEMSPEHFFPAQIMCMPWELPCPGPGLFSS